MVGKNKEKKKECVGKKLEERFVKVEEELKEIKATIQELKEIIERKKGAFEVNLRIPEPKPKAEVIFEWEGWGGAPHINEQGELIGYFDVTAKMIQDKEGERYVIINGYTPEGEPTKIVLHWPIVQMMVADIMLAEVEEEEPEEVAIYNPLTGKHYKLKKRGSEDD